MPNDVHNGASLVEEKTSLLERVGELRAILIANTGVTLSVLDKIARIREIAHTIGTLKSCASKNSYNS